MRLQKVAGAFVKQNGMTKNSNEPYRVTTVVLLSSPSAILTCQYPARRSILVKYRPFTSRSIKSYVLGTGYLFFTVILFKAL